MGRRKHSLVETETLLAQKDDQISNLDARLGQTITHLALVRDRLLSSLDKLDALQHDHSAALAAAALEQRRLEAKLSAAEDMARISERDRVDMRDAVGLLVQKVEATPDFRTWPRSQIHLSSLSTGPASSHTHGQRTSERDPDSHPNPNAEQLSYASTLISHFRGERDEALVRARRSEARVLELEARLARREAALAACDGCRDCLVNGPTARGSRWMDIRSPPFGERRRERRQSSHVGRSEECDEDEMADILDESMERNMELELEIRDLSLELDHAQTALAQGSRSPRPFHRHQTPNRQSDDVHPSQFVLAPAFHPDDEANTSLLSSSSFSPASSTSTTATSPAAETGTATPRQSDIKPWPPHVTKSSLYENGGVFRPYQDPDESFTQLADPFSDVKAHHDARYSVGDPTMAMEKHTAAVVTVSIPALRALEDQVAFLGDKIDAFAAERRAVEASIGQANRLPSAASSYANTVDAEVVEETVDSEPAGPVSPTRTQAGPTAYDHPHETCEATLLAARKREMELVERVRVLESTLADLQPQAQSQSPSQPSVIPKDDHTPWMRDAAVQTLFSPPPLPLLTPSSLQVADLLELDAEPPVLWEEAEEATRRGEWIVEGAGAEECGGEFGEIPMELATPLLPASAVLALEPGDEDADEAENSDGAEEADGEEVSESDEGSSVEEELDTRRVLNQLDLPVGGYHSSGSPPTIVPDDRHPGHEDLGLDVSIGNVSDARCHSTSPSPPPRTPAPDSPLAPRCQNPSPPPTQPTTPTSPTIAVGLFPPFPPHAHPALALTLPALHLHSYSQPDARPQSLPPQYLSSSTADVAPALHRPTNPTVGLGLRRAHTDTSMGTDMGVGAGMDAQYERAGAAHRFVMYRATSSFVAELRQIESRLAEATIQNMGPRTAGEEGQSVEGETSDAQLGFDTQAKP